MDGWIVEDGGLIPDISRSVVMLVHRAALDLEFWKRRPYYEIPVKKNLGGRGLTLSARADYCGDRAGHPYIFIYVRNCSLSRCWWERNIGERGLTYFLLLLPHYFFLI